MMYLVLPITMRIEEAELIIKREPFQDKSLQSITTNRKFLLNKRTGDRGRIMCLIIRYYSDPDELCRNNSFYSFLMIKGNTNG